MYLLSWSVKPEESWVNSIVCRWVILHFGTFLRLLLFVSNFYSSHELFQFFLSSLSSFCNFCFIAFLSCLSLVFETIKWRKHCPETFFPASFCFFHSVLSPLIICLLSKKRWVMWQRERERLSGKTERQTTCALKVTKKWKEEEQNERDSRKHESLGTECLSCLSLCSMFLLSVDDRHH